MGQLTNQFVSQSYQGLLNLANANTGLTANLQTVTDGIGTSSPLQISQTEVNISGSFFINNVPITNGTSGTSGTSGQNGSSGTSGTSGQSGSSGTSGTSGVSGSSGTSGTSGQSGSSGTSGANGSSGTSGTSGQNGSSGTSGTSGTSGVNGSSGTSGTSGVDGSSGTSGTSGGSGTSGTSGDSIFAQTGSFWNTTNNVGITGSFVVDGNTTLDGNVDITQGNTNIYSPLTRINYDLDVLGNTMLSGTLFVDDTSVYDGDMFVKTGSQLNFEIGDGNDGQYYRVGKKVNGEFGIVQDPGNYHLLDISSSYAEFLPPTYFMSGAFATGSLQVRSGSLSTISNNTTININNYLTSSLGGQSNIIKGWGENPTAGGVGATQANYTGSLRITGSNNIVSLPLIRPTAIGGGTDQQGYISGSDNIIGGNFSGIFLNTGSLLFPKTQGNILGNSSNIRMNFTTSSLAGGHPTISNNFVVGGSIQLNHNSGSVNAVQNAILGGALVSTQNFVTNTRPVISSNNIIGSVTLNHISSSINYSNNYNNATFTVNNHLSSSNITNNSLTVENNIFLGGSSNTPHNIWVTGSQNSNVSRGITDNLIGGRSNIISSSFVSSSNADLRSTIVYGNSLVVSGSHTTGTGGGSAFFGRFNDTGSLNRSQDIVFAVGTGTAAATRRTGFYIDSGSNVVTSGSLTSIGNATITGSLNVTGSVTIADAGDLTMYGHKMFNVGTFYDTTTQSGSAAVSQSISYNTTDISQGVTVSNNSRLTVTNAGTYNIQFSAQVLADTGADDVYIWLKKNGTNVADSAGVLYLNNNQEQIASWNYVVNAAANDYYELAWQSTNGDAVLLTEAAAGNVPRIPSIIVTVTQVR